MNCGRGVLRTPSTEYRPSLCPTVQVLGGLKSDNDLSIFRAEGGESSVGCRKSPEEGRERAGGFGLGCTQQLKMQVRSRAIAAVSDACDPLSDVDGLFGFDLDRALFEMSEQGKEVGSVLDEDVISEGILFVGATGRRIGVVTFDGVDLSVGRGKDLFGKAEEAFILVRSATMDAIVSVNTQDIEGEALGSKVGGGRFAESVAMGCAGAVAIGDPPAATHRKAQHREFKGLGLDRDRALKGAWALLEVKAQEQGIGYLIAGVAQGRER